MSIIKGSPRFFQLLMVSSMNEMENNRTMSRMEIIKLRLEDTLILDGDKLGTR